MALLEADVRNGKIDIASARNALGAMLNRAAKEGVDLGDHVSQRIYQPTIEDAQFARLSKIVGSPEHTQLVELTQRRLAGEEPDWVQGATHFLASEPTMLALEAREPSKYRSWRQWTGFDPETGQYRGVIMRDQSHAFLAPEGAYSAPAGSSSSQPPEVQTSAQPAHASVSQPSLGTAGSQAASGGLLADLFGDADAVNTDDMRQAFKAIDSNRNVEPLSEGTLPLKRRPVDLSRLMAILQSRMNLGTA